MKTLIIPLDGSALSERALSYVQALAVGLGARVMLLRVVTDAEVYTFLLRHAADLKIDPVLVAEGMQDQVVTDSLSHAAETYLEEHACVLRDAGLVVSTSVSAGNPAECIAETAQRAGDGLIVMGTHGYSGAQRWMLGSVADRVVHIATTPVLLVRSNVPLSEPLAIRRILVPLDGSANAEQALPVAADLARATGGELVLLRVVLPMPVLVPAFPPLGATVALSPDRADGELEQVWQYLSHAAAGLEHQTFPVTMLVEVGYPADVIVDAVSHPHADLIVMATHGRSSLQRWAVGSVADKVLHAAAVPVLLVRARAIEP